MDKTKKADKSKMADEAEIKRLHGIDGLIALLMVAVNLFFIFKMNYFKIEWDELLGGNVGGTALSIPFLDVFKESKASAFLYEIWGLNAPSGLLSMVAGIERVVIWVYVIGVIALAIGVIIKLCTKSSAVLKGIGMGLVDGCMVGLFVLYICNMFYIYQGGLPSMGDLGIGEYLLKLLSQFIEYAKHTDLWILVLVNFGLNFFDDIIMKRIIRMRIKQL